MALISAPSFPETVSLRRTRDPSFGGHTHNDVIYGCNLHGASTCISVPILLEA